MTEDPIIRWTLALKLRVGVDDPESARLVSAVTDFCAQRGITPDELLARWEEYPELLVRKNLSSPLRPILAVESFLIHNGINVFGEIKCVSGRAEDLIEQGAQFVPRSGDGS